MFFLLTCGWFHSSIQAAFKPSLLSSKSPSTGAILESLRILPDDDQDGLVDVTGQLKALSDGELLDLNGRVKIAGLIDTCIDIVVGGAYLDDLYTTVDSS